MQICNKLLSPNPIYKADLDKFFIIFKSCFLDANSFASLIPNPEYKDITKELAEFAKNATQTSPPFEYSVVDQLEDIKEIRKLLEKFISFFNQ